MGRDCNIMPMLMKLTLFEISSPLGRILRLGAALGKNGESILDLNAAYTHFLVEQEQRPQAKRWADFLFPADMRAFLELGRPAMVAAEETIQWLSSQSNHFELQGLNGARLLYRTNEVILKAPIQNPRTLRDFLTFEVHVGNGAKKRKEPIAEAWYKMPVYYKGNPSTLFGPDEDFPWPPFTRLLDYELELACVIGKEGKNIPESEAMDYIAGFTIMNDFSARDVQKGEMACRLGPAKAKDFGTAIGPWLVTPDEVGDIRNLRMQARINGETWSDGNSGTSHWTFAQMIAHTSREEVLYPGDLLASGTVGFGCGLELDRWLKENDVVELEIDGLGILRNRVLAPAKSWPLYEISSQ
jgi:2-keto-4-pentenoate hydratase/2-oxohepta-3-ene-1,7-dioic acid hydratase in catechol pathway